MPERRYGQEHKRLRARWAREIELGGVTCARCGLPILAGSPFDLDHADDGVNYRGPAHRRCNRNTYHRRFAGSSPNSRPERPALREDDPANGVFWGPPDPESGRQLVWSRPWYEWRDGS